MWRNALRFLAGILLVAGGSAFSTAAVAQDSEGQGLEMPLDVTLGFRGVGEIWQDSIIANHYRSSRFAGGGFAAVGLLPWVQGEIEVGYMRQDSNTGNTGVAPGALELVPVTLSVHARKMTSNAELYGGLGYSMAVFTESTSVGTVSGIKPGFELRTGVRIHTNLVQESMWSGNSGGVKRVDVELMFARRQHQPFGLGSGFDFSAWRLGIGMVARL